MYKKKFLLIQKHFYVELKKLNYPASNFFLFFDNSFIYSFIRFRSFLFLVRFHEASCERMKIKQIEDEGISRQYRWRLIGHREFAEDQTLPSFSSDPVDRVLWNSLDVSSRVTFVKTDNGRKKKRENNEDHYKNTRTLSRAYNWHWRNAIARFCLLFPCSRFHFLILPR